MLTVLALVQDAAVDLVGQDHQVVLDGQRAMARDVSAVSTPPVGLCRRVEDQQPGARRDQDAQLVDVDMRKSFSSRSGSGTAVRAART